MVKPDFALRLRRLREAAGFESAQAFAERLGMEPHAYRMYERGDRSPPLDRLLAICAALGVTPNDILPVPVSAPRRSERRAAS